MNQKKIKKGLRRVGSSSLSETTKQKLADRLHKASISNSTLFEKLVERQARKKAANITKEEKYKALPPIEYSRWGWVRTSPRK